MCVYCSLGDVFDVCVYCSVCDVFDVCVVCGVVCVNSLMCAVCGGIVLCLMFVCGVGL